MTSKRLPLLVASALWLLAPTSLSRPPADDPWLWMQEAQLTAPNGLGSAFGVSAALDGETALIGAYTEQWGGIEPGAAYVFVRSGSSWIQEARLVPNDPADDGRFGFSVALQGDQALIGAYGDDDAGDNTGSVYVFERSAGLWNQVAKLSAPDAGPDRWFGHAVALGGNVALIGAPADSVAGHNYAGSAYVFIGSGASWTFLQKIEASNPSSTSWFGWCVDLSTTTALIGAQLGNGAAYSSGAAYVFTKYGGAWHEQVKLVASDGAQYDRFGYSVAVDGDTALVGAPEDQELGWGTGAAYVFERSGSSWSQTQKILASDAVAQDKFGYAVALEAGTMMVSASYYHSDAGPGGVYVFHHPKDEWTEVEKLSLAVNESFGRCIALDGNDVVLGDPSDWPGHAYVYSRPPEPGFRYCFGDPGVDTPCPCNNDNDGSVPGSGCDNGTFASGAQLTAYGAPNVAADEVFLRTTNVEPHNSGLYFQGTNQVNGGAGVVFGDGLRCAGGQVVRLQVRFADESGANRTTIPIAQKGGVSPGDIRWYQYWYRTTVAPPCGPWVNDFNTSNGYSITWTP